MSVIAAESPVQVFTPRNSVFEDSVFKNKRHGENVMVLVDPDALVAAPGDLILLADSSRGQTLLARFSKFGMLDGKAAIYAEVVRLN